MAGANLRYLAIRRRLATLISADPHMRMPLDVLVGELYRALPHYRVIVLFRVVDVPFELVAVRGVDPAMAAGAAVGLARVAQQTGEMLFVPDIRRDERVRPAREGIVGEIALPIAHADRVVGVLDVQSDRPGALALADRELLQWLAGEMGPGIVKPFASR